MLIKKSSDIRREPGVILPIVRELPADLETPVSVYLKLVGQGPSFLLESVTGGEQLARYSFIGVAPRSVYVIRGRTVQTIAHGESSTKIVAPGQDPMDALRLRLNAAGYRPSPGLPRFVGGLVGYFGYEYVRMIEPAAGLSPHPEIPDAVFLHADSVIAFDHAFGRLLLIANAHMGQEGPATQQAAIAAAEARLDRLQERLAGPLPSRPVPPFSSAESGLLANMTRSAFTSAVRKAKEHIRAGDIFQVVLSQRIDRQTSATPFAIYRALRRLNPSPYMFYLDLDDLAGAPALRLIGASPELHVRLEDRLASVRPIAGTRRRGETLSEDLALEQELLADPKERAEHVMLVDLARNDLGRVCDYGSVQVREQMSVERYSHVMHIVSQVDGQLRPGYDAFDLMRATFPAGTVSGAPKIRAMQIIQELESDPRGPYAGAVGYFSYNGSMDTCITIRTLKMRGQTVSVQSGAGVVADSDPVREYEETLSKAMALAEAVDNAQRMQAS